ncbi:MAG: carbohydrate porin [Chthoniobacterales bacterium]
MKINLIRLLNTRFAAAVIAAILIVSGVDLQAGTVVTNEKASTETQDSWVADWWNGKYMTGNWFGARDTLADHGVTFKGEYQGVFYGLLSGGKDPGRGTYDQQLKFALTLDMEKMAHIQGLSFLTEVRWRQPSSGLMQNPNNFVGASGNFQPSHFESGTQWRWTRLEAKWVSPDQNVTIVGGRTSPYHYFAQQPLRKLFINNSIEGSEGIGGNDPWSSSYVAWGGHIQVRPVKPLYAQFGIYQANRNFSDSANHGLAWEGYNSGSWLMAETGYETEKNPDLNWLPAKVAFGGFWFGQSGAPAFLSGTTQQGEYGFYWQYDQMLYREASPEPKSKTGFNKDTGKKEVITGDVKPSKQGLYMFNFVEYAPQYNNPLSFYFHSGLVYQGLIPTRDNDYLMTAFGYGNYSSQLATATAASGGAPKSYEAVWEVDYRLFINGWSWVQPYSQYIVRPNGTGAVQNAWVVGFSVGANF